MEVIVKKQYMPTERKKEKDKNINKECCMKGYPNYPIGANIIKYLTILLRNNFMRGSVAN